MHKSFPLLVLFSLLASLVSGSPIESRYATNLQAPSNYRSSWGSDGRRLSYGSSSGLYIDRSTLPSGSLGQSHVDTCAERCESTNGCGFFHPIELAGGNICALYRSKVSKSEATFTQGAGSVTGAVRFSFGFTREETVQVGGRHPSLSPGSTLRQFTPCSSSQGQIPLIVNGLYQPRAGLGSSRATSAVIVQHGMNSNLKDAYDAVSNVIEDSTVLIAPGFYETRDSPSYRNGVASNFYDPSRHLAWANGWLSWAGGLSGRFNNQVQTCSSFDGYDALLALLADKSKYPNLSRVTFVGHSNGAAAVSRYSIFANGPPRGIRVRYVVANAPTIPFFTKHRPSPVPAGCDVSSYGYGLDSNLPRYLTSRFSGSKTDLFRRWVARDVQTLNGNEDTYSGFGDIGCQAEASGGRDRRDRNYAHWAYKNMRAGTSTDVSKYKGYVALRTSEGTGVPAMSPPASVFNHRDCIVDGVGHVASQMYSSSCGRAAITGRSMPAGARP